MTHSNQNTAPGLQGFDALGYVTHNSLLQEALGIEGTEGLACTPLGKGEHNLNFRLSGPSLKPSCVLRINVAKQPFHENQVAYEAAALRALEPSGCTPRLLFLDDSPMAPGKGALVISFCEGSELDFDHLREGDLDRVARIMANVAAVPVENTCPLHRPRDPLAELYEESLARFRSYRASAFEDARITKWAETFIKAAKPQERAARNGNTTRAIGAPTNTSPCGRIVNTETLPSHFLLPEAGGAGEGAGAGSHSNANNSAAGAGAASAADAGAAANPHPGASATPIERSHPGWFVDWERPIIGEVAQDVAYFTSPTTSFWDSDYLFPQSQVEPFVERYWQAVAGRFERGDFDERFGAWRKMTALRSVTWCCKALITYGPLLAGKDGGSPGNKAHSAAVHTTEKTLEKLPVYLSDDFMERIAAECFGL